MERKVKRSISKGDIKASFTNRKFKGGAYATLISVVVIAVAIVVNLVVGELGLTADLTASGRYSLLDSTKEYIRSIGDKINIYYLIQDGDSFDYYDVDRFAEGFNNISDKVQIVRKDPVRYPGFARSYTDEDISQYGMLVVNETNGRARYVDVYDYVQTEFSYSTYSYDVTGIDLEGQLVSALRYVMTEKLPMMYILEGHGEKTVTDTLASGIAKENVSTEELMLLIEGEVPADCEILMIYQPETDITEDELTLIEEYLVGGGNVLFIADLTTPTLPNLCRLLDYYGISLTEGYVLEGDSRHYMMRTPYQLVPDVEYHEITDGVADKRYALMPYATGIMIRDDIRSTISVNPILTTTSKAYAKPTLNITTYEKEDADYEGPFYLGVEMNETYDGVTSRMVVYSCVYMLDDSLIAGGTYANGDLFYNTLNYLTDLDTSVSIRAVSLTEEYVTVTAAQGGTYAIFYILIVPLFFIVTGIIVTVRRRHL